MYWNFVIECSKESRTKIDGSNIKKFCVKIAEEFLTLEDVQGCWFYINVCSVKLHVTPQQLLGVRFLKVNSWRFPETLGEFGQLLKAHGCVALLALARWRMKGKTTKRGHSTCAHKIKH